MLGSGKHSPKRWSLWTMTDQCFLRIFPICGKLGWYSVTKHFLWIFCRTTLFRASSLVISPIFQSSNLFDSRWPLQENSNIENCTTENFRNENCMNGKFHERKFHAGIFHEWKFHENFFHDPKIPWKENFMNENWRKENCKKAWVPWMKIPRVEIPWHRKLGIIYLLRQFVS